MPRDGSGNYTLPAGNPVATGTTIQSGWANSTMADIAVQLNNVLTRDGVLGPVQAFKLVDGTVALPGVSFNSEPGMGFYRPSATTINWSAANAVTATLDASNGNSGFFKLYPRLGGTSSATFSLSNQPYGSANRTDFSIQMGATGVTIGTTGYGTGTQLPITFTGPTNIAPPGMYAEFMLTSAPSGWIAGNGGTIGSPSSGATTRANDDCLALFTVWWAQFSNAQLPIQTSTGAASTRGASAAADWAAGKRLVVFDVRNRFARAADGANTVIGVTYADTIFNHAHNATGTAADHLHGMPNLSHTHGDFGHGHSDAGHGHTYDRPNPNSTTTGGGGAFAVGTVSGASTGTGFANIQTGYANLAPALGTYNTGAADRSLGLSISVSGPTSGNPSGETAPKSIGMLGCFKL